MPLKGVGRVDNFQKQVDDIFNGLDERVQEEINDYLLDCKRYALNEIRRCESPIEQLLGIAFLNETSFVQGYLDSRSPRTDGYLAVLPQYQIDTPSGKFRLDFLLELRTNLGTFRLAVECDGHAFHEKTKQQAARDKRRDRAIVQEGVAIVRFTGSEIWANPRRCANEAVITLLSMLDRSNNGAA